MQQREECVVVSVDLCLYSDIANFLESAAPYASNTVRDLNQQIEEHVSEALAAVADGDSLHDRLLGHKNTGDGALLIFRAEDAERAVRFSFEFQTRRDRANVDKRAADGNLLKYRFYRVGCAVGEVSSYPTSAGGHDYAGTAIAKAVRLESAASPGGLLVEEEILDRIPDSDLGRRLRRRATVRGKRSEVFRARRWAPGFAAPWVLDERRRSLARAGSRALAFLVGGAAVVATLAFTYKESVPRDELFYASIYSARDEAYVHAVRDFTLPQLRPTESLSVESRPFPTAGSGSYLYTDFMFPGGRERAAVDNMAIMHTVLGHDSPRAIVYTGVERYLENSLGEKLDGLVIPATTNATRDTFWESQRRVRLATHFVEARVEGAPLPGQCSGIDPRYVVAKTQPDDVQAWMMNVRVSQGARLVRHGSVPCLWVADIGELSPLDTIIVFWLLEEDPPVPLERSSRGPR